MRANSSHQAAMLAAKLADKKQKLEDLKLEDTIRRLAEAAKPDPEPDNG